MARKIVERDYKAYARKIYSFYNAKKKMPNYEDLKSIFDVRSKDTVHRLIKDLVNMDKVLQDENGKLLPINEEAFAVLNDGQKNKISRLLNKKIVGKANQSNGIVRLLGAVEAGFPSFVEMDELDTITLDEWLLGDRFATFMLKVKGDSMQDAGVIEGDYVVVERGKEAKMGDMVLAEVDGAWTLKWLRKDKIGNYLEPANKKYKNIRPKNEMQISAVVVALVRKYGK